MRKLVFKHIGEKYDTLPDYPFDDDTAVLRNRYGKWYGIIMNVSKRCLGFNNEERIDVLNVKCNPEVIRSLVTEPGFLPAYHMNKKHWLSILLDGSVDIEEIYALIGVSYELVTNRGKNDEKKK